MDAMRTSQRDGTKEIMGAISFVVGNATEPIGTGPRWIVHVCNDVGGWGKGFVLALSSRWSAPEAAYRRWYAERDSNDFALGAVQFVPVTDEITVCNLVGQRDIRSRGGLPPVRYDAIESGLGKVAAEAVPAGSTVHMPRIGCGLAGGRWEQIEALIQETLVPCGIDVTVYDFPS